MSTPFTIGCTSFLIHAGWAENVKFAVKMADKPTNIELLFAEVSDDATDYSSLISSEEVAELAQIARESDIAYSVHLPVNIDLTREEPANRAVAKIARLHERIAPLGARPLVLHVEAWKETDDRWHACARAAIAQMVELAGDTPVVLENLEEQPLDWLAPFLGPSSPPRGEGAASTLLSRCIDIGHLWKDKRDPAPILEKWLPHTRHIHLHGLADRDHRSLAHMGEAKLDAVTRALLAHPFTGIVTLEVFSHADFLSSREALLASLEREHADRNAARLTDNPTIHPTAL